MFKNPNFKVLILELNNSGKAYKINDEVIYNMVVSHGFKPYTYEPENRNLIELKTYNKKQFNTIFVRDLPFVLERLKVSQDIRILDKKY